MGKWHVSSRGFILDLVGGGGDGGLLFHFILSKIVALKGSRVPAAHPHLEIPKVLPGNLARKLFANSPLQVSEMGTIFLHIKSVAF